MNMALTTSLPTSDSELQLYRVLEKANLISYYDTFIQQGGDDVQQLCEASDEEFMEIMALVGMSTKPLHVRRLQKTLQEWVVNPEKFKTPLTSPPQNLAIPFSLGLQQAAHQQQPKMTPHAKWTGPASIQDNQSVVIPISQLSSPSTNPGAAGEMGLMDHEENPVLTPETIQGLREAAEIVMGNEQPSSSPPPLNRKLVKDLQHIFEMPIDHPDRFPEIRRWSAIYGRFDSKRRSDKPLSLHEVTVNEASAQLCDLDPFLLAQREKLFPLARQVVRESGYRYKHGHSSSKMVNYGSVKSTLSRGDGSTNAKKPKLDGSPNYRDAESTPNPRTLQAEIMKLRREERMNEITSLLTTIKQNQSDTKASIAAAKSEDNLQKVYDLQIELEKLTTQQLLLMTEQTDLIKKQRRSDRYYVAKAREKGEIDDGSEGQESEAGNLEETMEGNVGEINSETGAPSESSNSERVEVTSSSTPVTTSSKLTPRKKDNQNPTKLLVQHTLMDEGLRLAQAYGNTEDTSQEPETGEEDNPSNHDDLPSNLHNQLKSPETMNNNTSLEQTDILNSDMIDVINNAEQNG